MTHLVKKEPLQLSTTAMETDPAEVPVRPTSDSFPLPGLYGLLRRLWHRRKGLVAAIVATVTLTTVLQVFTVSPTFQASARVQVDPDPGSVLPYPDLSKTAIDFLATETYLQTQRELLKSERVARRVARSLNLTQHSAFNQTPYPGLVVELWVRVKTALLDLVKKRPPAEVPPELAAVRRLLEGFEVKILPGTRLLQASFLSHDAPLAADIANSFAREFIRMTLEDRSASATEARNFLENQLLDLRGKLEQSEEQLIQYARETGILNIDRDQEIARRELDQLTQGLIQVEAQFLKVQAQHAQLQSATADNFPLFLETEKIRELESHLNLLNQKLASLSARFGSRWPEAQQVARELAEVKEQLEREKQRALQEAHRDYLAARQHFELLSERLRRQKELAGRLAQNLIQYSILEREIQTNKALYEGLLQRFKETNVSATLPSGNMRIVEPAAVPLEPLWPDKLQALLLAVLLGLFLGGGLALVLESTDRTLKTSEEVEAALPLPCLSIIPRLQDLRDLAGSRRLGDGRTENGDIVPVLYEEAGRPAWEAYRSLRTSIQSDPPSRTILVTSALPREGKTTTALNTAIAFAQAGSRTLLIDLNLRDPALAQIFGEDEEEGMSRFLAGQSSLRTQLRQTSLPRLFLLPSGTPPQNPSELISSRRMEDALRLMVQFFDVILIDTPAILHYTDALSLSSRVDKVVLVTRGEQTPVEAVQRAYTRLSRLNASLLGMVLNAVDMARPEYAYDYGYAARTGRNLS